MSGNQNGGSKTPDPFAFVQWLLGRAIRGVPPLSSAKQLAEEYFDDSSYSSDDERVDALIRWEATKNFSSGFLTGIGGLVTLPAAVPAALGTSWVIQARLAGAIAAIYGHPLWEDRVRTLILLTILGDAAKEVLKEVGVNAGRKLTAAAIGKLSGRTLSDINKQVGCRLVTKGGCSGAMNLGKMIPLAGGFVAGTVDATSCYMVGRTAKQIFRADDFGQRGANAA